MTEGSDGMAEAGVTGYQALRRTFRGADLQERL